MHHAFDAAYWERHWDHPGAGGPPGANEHVVREVEGLTPGSAVDAGCGAGAEVVWLASQGWRVVGVDVAAGALELAAAAAGAADFADRVEWVRADLTEWTPAQRFDLVMTSYAHPAMPQLEFFDRIAAWTAPLGTLLIVAHGHDSSTRHGGDAPPEAVVTADAVAGRLDPGEWDVHVSAELARTVVTASGAPAELHDVVVRATRRG